MDALQKIREEEQAKLEALREREREKTKQAVERERERLEAELAKEIKDLENQLERAKNASIKVKAHTPANVDSISFLADSNLLKELEAEVENDTFEQKDEQEEALMVDTIDEKVLEKADLAIEDSKLEPIIEEPKPEEIGPKEEKQVEVPKIELLENEDFEEQTKKQEKQVEQKVKEVEKPKTSTVKKSTTAASKTKEKEKLAKEKEKEKEKQRLAKEKEKEKQRLAKEKEKLKLEKEKSKKLVTSTKSAAAKVKEEKAVAKEVELVVEREYKDQNVPVELSESTANLQDEEGKFRDEVLEQNVEEKVSTKELKVIEENSIIQEEPKAIEEENETQETLEVVEEESVQTLENKKESNEEKEIIAVKQVSKEKEDIQKPIEEPKQSIEELLGSTQKEEVVISPVINNETNQFNVSNKGSNAAITSLQKLREKIAAQKLLERELMEREAQRAQEKDRTLQEKYLSLHKIIEEEENNVTLEELEQERRNVDILRSQKEELEKSINELKDIIDKLIELNVDGIKVINNETWTLNQEFVNLGVDHQILTNTIKEIEEELDSLSKSHETNIRKLIDAEESYKTLEQLYQKQEKVINDLNKQVNNLREQVAREKVLNREYTSLIEKLKYEKGLRIPTQQTYSKELLGEHQHILSDLERLNDEVHKLISSSESNKFKEEVVKRDLEIEALKKQIELLKNEEKINQEMIYPFYANPMGMFVPKNFVYANQPQPQSNVFDSYLQELEKLRKDINELKQPKITEPITIPQVFEEKEKVSEPKAEPEFLKNLESEVVIEEAKKDSNEDILQRIKELETQVREKDELIESIQTQIKELNEQDIFDPNFKRKIRVIRDKKLELQENIKLEEDNYVESLKSIKEKIDIVQQDIDRTNDKLFDLDLAFRQNRDHSSQAKDNYEKTKSKIIVERGLHEEKLHTFEADFERTKNKYQIYLQNAQNELRNLDNEEVTLIEHYLNKMRNDSSVTSKLKSVEEEKQNIVNQLDQLKSNNQQVNEIDPYAEAEEKNRLRNQISTLEVECEELNKTYNIQLNQLSELKTELDKRLELEKRFKINDDDVFAFSTMVENLKELETEYQNKVDLINSLQLEIVGIDSKDEQLKVKAKISDLTVHRDDLRSKIDYYKIKLNEFRSNDNVMKFYMIVNQIEQIIEKQSYLKEQLELTKAEISSKTLKLEQLKGEFSRL